MSNLPDGRFVSVRLKMCALMIFASGLVIIALFSPYLLVSNSRESFCWSTLSITSERSRVAAARAYLTDNTSLSRKSVARLFSSRQCCLIFRGGVDYPVLTSAYYYFHDYSHYVVLPLPAQARAFVPKRMTFKSSIVLVSNTCGLIVAEGLQI